MFENYIEKITCPHRIMANILDFQSGAERSKLSGGTAALSLKLTELEKEFFDPSVETTAKLRY